MKKSILILALLLSYAGLTSAQGMDEEFMAKWQESMTPNENHAWLAKMEGNWTYTNYMWMEQGKDPDVTTGKAVMQMLCQGRYLQESHHGTSMNMPFEGHNTTAYDNLKGKYRTNWMDNFGTGFMTGEGTREGNVLTVMCTYPNFDGGEDKFKMVTTVKNENEHMLQMFMYDADGNELKHMEIKYKRVK